MKKFIGRQRELKRLLAFTEKRIASFIVIKGRRRIGKSRLVEEFSQHFDHFYSFVGIPPYKRMTAKSQRDEFSRQMAQEFKTAWAHYDDWGSIFQVIGERAQSGKVLLFFDEISWMGSKDPSFLGKIKNLWDLSLKNNDQLIFIICGSASSWIQENILSSTGFVGRISYTLTLNELSLADCNQFWPANIAAYEKFKILSVTGGVPRYLEEINPKQSAEENIRNLCFSKGGFLVEEFERIFSNIFIRKTDFYARIIQTLSDGPMDQNGICAALNTKRHGRIAEYLQELEVAGFIARDYTWNIRTGQDLKLSLYRLADNYLRFYLKYITKSLSQIQSDTFELKSLTALPQWHSILGFQFENMVLNNRRGIHRLLQIKPEEIICENPFFQKKTATQLGCQIDYMVQTKFNTLYVCEIKFSNKAIGTDVIAEVQAKIDAIKSPRGFSYRPVLIHVNGVTDEVIERDYFASIIDFSDLLKQDS